MYLLYQHTIYAWRGDNASTKLLLMQQKYIGCSPFRKHSLCVRSGVHGGAERGMRKEAINFIREVVIEIKLHLMCHD